MAPGPSLGAVTVVAAFSTFGLVHFLPEFSIRSSTPLTFLALEIAGLALLIVWRSQIWPKLLSPLRKLPSVPGGSFWQGQYARILREDTGLPMREWVNSIDNDGLLQYTAMFNTERVLLTSPEALREVLVTKSYEFVKSELIRETLGRLLGFGVLLAEGEEHKIQRKHLMPAFAYRHVKDLVPTFWAKSAEMLRALDSQNGAKLSDKDGGAVLRISGWLSRCTLDIIGLAGMGFDFKAIENPNSELNVTYRTVFSPSKQQRALQLLSLIVPPALVNLIPVSRNHEVASAVEVIRRTSREVIQEKKVKMQNAKGERVDKDIISVALESGGFSDENLIDQTMTFLAAGHETTSTATMWALVLLSKHPEAQRKLREEIRSILPSPMMLDGSENADSASLVTADMIDQCHYLHAVCNEVLRFHPPVPMTRRIASHDTTILGSPIPKGTNIMICPAAVNFSTSMWGPDAAEFNPDRWLGKSANSGGAASNFSLLTFLHGPRSCIGEKFARSEFASLLAAIVGHYEVALADPDKKIEAVNGVTIRPKDDLEMRIKVVDGW